jgi:tungstate transport system substrate-binding protein
MRTIAQYTVRSFIAFFLIGLSAVATAADRYITVASTTSTENSGLFEFLLPMFTAESGIEARVVAVGTGKALKMAERGDADVLLVHHKPSELSFVDNGFGVKRYDVMYNDYVIVGPQNDPAEVAGMGDAKRALRSIAKKQAVFVSRGDDSGTHKKELSLWRSAGIEGGEISSEWYRETGSGMGATLNVASGVNAYTLTDRATWLKFSNRGQLSILVEGDPPLFNQYGVILVNAERHPHIKSEDGETFIQWLLSDRGQNAISAYTIDGNQAFFANAAN